MSDNKFNVLFLCTGNSARSVLSEALLNRWGKKNFIAYSAGSNPKGDVHPKTIEILKKNNFETEKFRSKSWDEFTKPDAPHIDFVITVCSNAANETCPVFPGNPVSAHWNIADPAREFENEEDQDREFFRVFMELEQRIQLLTNLPHDKLNKMTIHDHLQKTTDAK